MVFLKKKMRTRLIFLVIIVLIFLYWHGVSNIASAKGWKIPGLWEILKAGARF
jgi:hypothetical protein